MSENEKSKLEILKTNLECISNDDIFIWVDPAEKTYFRVVLLINYDRAHDPEHEWVDKIIDNFSECLKHIDSTKYKYADDSIYYLKTKAKYRLSPRSEIIEELRNYATKLNITYNF